MTKNEVVDVNSLTPEQMEALQNEMNTRRFNSLEKTTEKLDERVTKIEVETPVSPSTSNFLTRMRRSRVIECLGGKRSKAYRYEYPKNAKEHYKKLSNKTFAEMERDFKDYFNIDNYGDLPKKSRDEAEQYINQWGPSINTQLEIKQINNQIELLARE